MPPSVLRSTILHTWGVHGRTEAFVGHRVSPDTSLRERRRLHSKTMCLAQLHDRSCFHWRSAAQRV